MPEQTTFRERRIETCREKLTSRLETIEIIQKALERMNEVKMITFDDPRTAIKKKKLAFLIAVFGGDPDGTNASQNRHWTENPRHVVSTFLQDIREIFRSTASKFLIERITDCMKFYKNQHPNVSGNISEITGRLRILEMAGEIWFQENIEDRNIVDISIMSLRGGVKKTLLASLV